MANELEFPKGDGDYHYGNDVNAQYYQSAHASNMDTASISVSTSATLIVAARTARKGLVVYNNSSQTVFLGASGVATSDGYELLASESIYLYNKEALYGIVASSTSDIRFIEVW